MATYSISILIYILSNLSLRVSEMRRECRARTGLCPGMIANQRLVLLEMYAGRNLTAQVHAIVQSGATSFPRRARIQVTIVVDQKGNLLVRSKQ